MLLLWCAVLAYARCVCVQECISLLKGLWKIAGRTKRETSPAMVPLSHPPLLLTLATTHSPTLFHKKT
jgi:hypothetical protein